MGSTDRNVKDGSFFMLAMHCSADRVSIVRSATASAFLSYESLDGSFANTWAQFGYFILEN